MKYRLLNSDELVEFEKEFIEFLVINGVHANDWEKMKLEENEKAQNIIASFSDVIIEGVLRKVSYLEFKSTKYVSAVQCLSDKMINITVTAKEQGLDFSNVQDHTKVDYHKLEKKYIKSKEEEIFALTKKGFEIGDGVLFKELILAYAQTL